MHYRLICIVLIGKIDLFVYVSYSLFMHVFIYLFVCRLCIQRSAHTRIKGWSDSIHIYSDIIISHERARCKDKDEIPDMV